MTAGGTLTPPALCSVPLQLPHVPLWVVGGSQACSGTLKEVCLPGAPSPAFSSAGWAGLGQTCDPERGETRSTPGKSMSMESRPGQAPPQPSWPLPSPHAPYSVCPLSLLTAASRPACAHMLQRWHRVRGAEALVRGARAPKLTQTESPSLGHTPPACMDKAPGWAHRPSLCLSSLKTKALKP